MSRADLDRWERKYAAGNPNPTFAPNPLLLQYAHLLDGPGIALDLACGVGHNAIFLAQRGYRVLAIDASVTGLRYGRAAIAAADLAVLLVAADLERFVLPPALFNAVAVFRYLERALLPAIKSAVTPGGLVIYETFNINRLHAAPRMKRAYLLEPGELTRWFADFETIATNDGPDITTELTYWIGRKTSRK